jgi:hypothetical protein
VLPGARRTTRSPTPAFINARASGETCGAPDYSDIQLGELVMPKGQVYAYDREVGTLHFIIDALIPFRQIKASTKKLES